MSYLAALRERRVTPRAVEHLFRVGASAGKYEIFLIVEGEEDEDFYGYIFEEMHPNITYQVIVCGGKGGVLGLRDFVDREYGGSVKVAFFLDRDHDSLIGLDYSRNDTYVTDGYSVEWFICTKAAFEAAFKRNYAISQHDPLIEEFSSFFDSCNNEVMPRFRAVMALVVAMRLADWNPDLSGLSPAAFFRFEGGKYRRVKTSLTDVYGLVGVEGELSLAQVVEASRRVRKMDDVAYVRGKLVMSFYLDLLDKFGRSGDRKKANGRSLRARVQLGKKNFVHYVRGIVPTPDSLRVFMEALGVQSVV